MIYFRFGTNLNKRKKADTLFADTDVILKGSDIEKVSQYLGEDIFGNKLTVRIEDWQNEKDRQVLYDNIKGMQSSTNIFLIDEVNVLSATATKISKYCEKIFDCSEEVVKPDPFPLANFIVAKDKKKAWIEFVRLKKIMPAEDLQGVLFWKMKSIRNKSLALEMIKMRYEAHEGKASLYDELEKLILKI